MEQSSSDWLESEIETAEILTHLHQTFSLFSHVPYSWVCRKKRSAIQNSPSSNGGATVVPPPNAVKAKVSSPKTPLSFPTTESDEKPKHSETRTSLKRKKQHYLSIIQDLTKTKDSTTQEIANVKRQCEELKLFNSKLKAKQKEININGPKGEYKDLNLMKLYDIINNSVNTFNSTTQNQEQRQAILVKVSSIREVVLGAHIRVILNTLLQELLLQEFVEARCISGLNNTPPCSLSHIAFACTSLLINDSLWEPRAVAVSVPALTVS